MLDARTHAPRGKILLARGPPTSSWATDTLPVLFPLPGKRPPQLLVPGSVAVFGAGYASAQLHSGGVRLAGWRPATLQRRSVGPRFPPAESLRLAPRDLLFQSVLLGGSVGCPGPVPLCEQTTTRIGQLQVGSHLPRTLCGEEQCFEALDK